MNPRRISVFAFMAAILAVCGCMAVPPAVYHEGRTAELSNAWPPEPAGGLSYQIWQYQDRTNTAREERDLYLLGGLFTGQKLGRFAFEEGFIASGRGVFRVGLEGGVGLRRPSIALRGSFYPLWLSGRGAQFALKDGWWQASLLGGFRLGGGSPALSVGAITSRLGIGPTLLGEYRYQELALRGQGSVTFKAPWAPGNVAGRVITFGISAARAP